MNDELLTFKPEKKTEEKKNRGNYISWFLLNYFEPPKKICSSFCQKFFVYTMCIQCKGYITLVGKVILEISFAAKNSNPILWIKSSSWKNFESEYRSIWNAFNANLKLLILSASFHQQTIHRTPLHHTRYIYLTVSYFQVCYQFFLFFIFLFSLIQCHHWIYQTKFRMPNTCTFHRLSGHSLRFVYIEIPHFG